MPRLWTFAGTTTWFSKRRAAEQADEADKVRDGEAARPLQLILGVVPTTEA
jgi:hypothetical protein